MSILRSLIDALVSAIKSPESPQELAASLDHRASLQSENLDWRRSIVDLMKLVGMDSSVEARDRLADEMGYPGWFDGSAEMNMWMHERLLRDLANRRG